jgi:hypothetical protein
MLLIQLPAHSLALANQVASHIWWIIFYKCPYFRWTARSSQIKWCRCHSRSYNHSIGHWIHSSKQRRQWSVLLRSQSVGQIGIYLWEALRTFAQIVKIGVNPAHSALKGIKHSACACLGLTPTKVPYHLRLTRILKNCRRSTLFLSILLIQNKHNYLLSKSQFLIYTWLMSK